MTHRRYAFGLIVLVAACCAAPAFAAPGATEQGSEGATALRPPSGLTVTNPVIKGDIPTGAYHLPDCPEYPQVDPATMLLFVTEDEAQRAGLHKAETCP
jgi:hypothetical protein